MAKDNQAPSVAIVARRAQRGGRDRPPRREPARPDYQGRIEVVVASDELHGPEDVLVEELAGRDGRVRLLRCRAAARWLRRTQAVRTIEADIVAFADAGAVWEPDALRMLVRSLADPEVGYVAGKVAFRKPEGTNREGLYWRYELWLRGRICSRLYYGRERSLSTPCAAPTTSRSIRASVTTSPSRT